MYHVIVNTRRNTMKELQSFAKDCVSDYATYDKCDDFYSLHVSDLPDFVQHEFAALIIRENQDWASEATGPDNKHWDTKMLPALIKHLSDTTDRDEQIEFNTIWRDCVTDYMSNHMQEFIDEALSEFNEELGYTHTESEMYGVAAYGPI